MAQIYNAPKVGVAGNQSTIGPQFNTHYWDRKSLMDAAEEMFFSPLADVKTMPKHYGKELKAFYYVPLLDDLNVSDQGIDAAGVASTAAGSGALYAGSRDIGTITGKMPTLTEDGGRVNRVGFTRLEKTGQIAEYGFFTEFTEDSLMFDTDSELYGHLSREMLRGANEINEDLLQVDLLNSADVKVFGGTATDVDEVSGASGGETLLTKADLQKMSIILDDNRTPKKTTIIKGSKMTDTKVISASRIAYIGSELQIMFTEMTGYIPVEQYADAATIMNGEIGAIPGAHLRIVVVPQMMHWAGAGAVEGTNAGYQVTGGNYDVAPILVVGDESFATIGLQGMGGKGKQKFRIIVKKPGAERADYRDPFGKLGFSSISFWYGFIKLRGERIAVAYSPIPE